MLDDYLNDILSLCAAEFNVSIEEILSKSKKQELVYARKAFCIIVKEAVDIKLDIMSKKLCKSLNSVSSFITLQPENKYYNVCLRRIRSRVKPFE